MAEYKHAVTFAALLFLYWPSLTSNKLGAGCECNTFCSLVALTAAFAAVAASDLTAPFQCKLPAYLHFLYEFLLSLVIFEVVVRVIWDRAECFLVGGLPSALGGRCLLFGLLCPHRLLFVALSYLVAFALLFTVLLGYGVVTGAPSPPHLPLPLPAIPDACRKCLNSIRGRCSS